MQPISMRRALEWAPGLRKRPPTRLGAEVTKRHICAARLQRQGVGWLVGLLQIAAM